MINYDNKRFRSIENTGNGEVGAETIFHYQQEGELVSATYSGGSIVFGHLIALADEAGVLDMRYHHLNVQGELRSGRCQSVPEILADGRLRLQETWTWNDGGGSGSSVIEEM